MRIATYTIMSVSIVVIAFFLIAVILGYRFDSKAGRIEQSGLVQYNSTPGGAQISVDGIKTGARTAASNTLLPGNHTFTMQRDGYETWQKTLAITAGTVTGLNYARLVPISRPLETVRTLPALSSVVFSPQGRFALAHQDETSPSFTLYDLRNDTAVKQTALQLPATSYSEAETPDVVHHFTIGEWDEGGRYVLIKHDYNDKTEWLVLDTTDPSTTADVTAAFNIDFTDPHFSGTSGNILYVLSNGDIRKIDRDAGTISRPLASNVKSYMLYGTDVVTYVTNYDPAAKSRMAGFIRDGDKAPYILRTTTSDPSVPLYVATAHYYNQDYIAIAEGTKVDILAGTYPSSPDDTSSMKLDATYTLAPAPQYFFMSYNGRFVLSQSGDTYMSYDLERNVKSDAEHIAGTGDVRKLEWLDDYYVWSDRSGVLTIAEFDGTNVHAINPVASGFDASLSSSGRYLYSVGKAKDGYALQRVKMILG